jgi:NAD(P)-dependent dehydrogenase (short-subunit alcohol dehydrogenase family)
LGKIRVNLLNPGPIATEMRKEAMPGENAAGLKKPADILHNFIDLLKEDCKISGKIINCQETVDDNTFHF